MAMVQEARPTNQKLLWHKAPLDPCWGSKEVLMSLMGSWTLVPFKLQGRHDRWPRWPLERATFKLSSMYKIQPLHEKEPSQNHMYLWLLPPGPFCRCNHQWLWLLAGLSHLLTTLLTSRPDLQEHSLMVAKNWGTRTHFPGWRQVNTFWS